MMTVGRVGQLLVITLFLAVSLPPHHELHSQGANDAISSAVRSAISSALRTSVRDATGQIVSAMVHKTTLVREAPPGRITRSFIGPNRKTLFLAFDDGAQRVWNFDTGAQQVLAAKSVGEVFGEIGARGLFLDRSGRLAAGTLDSRTQLVQAAPSASRALQISEESSLLIHGRTITIVAASDGGGLSPSKTVQASGEIRDAWAMGDGFFVVSVGDELVVYDGRQGQEIERLPGLPDGATLLDAKVSTTRGLKPTLFALSLGRTMLVDWGEGEHSKLKLDAQPTVGAFSDDDETLTVVLVDGTLRQFSRSGKQTSKIRTKNFGEAIEILSFSGGSRMAVLFNDGAVRIFDRDSGRSMVSAYSTRRGWLVLDDFGRFDAPSANLDVATWKVATQEIPIERLSRSYFEPGLLTRYVTRQTQTLRTPAFDVNKGLPLSPTVQEVSFLSGERSASKAAQLVVTARSIGNSVESIELFHNGKKVPSGNIIADDSQKSDQVAVRSVVYNVKPEAGENVFEAVPVGLGQIEGESLAVREQFLGKHSVSDLHVLSIGIDTYNLRDLSLGYAASDAKTIGRLFSSKQRLYKKTDVTTLLNKSATKDKIIRAFDGLASRARPEDTVIVYLAGHGIVIDGEWHFVAQDIRSSDKRGVANSSITTGSLIDMLEQVPARNVLLILDTCYSGAVTKDFSNFGVHRASTVISRETGLAVLAAARADQEAVELVRLGAGLFSFTINRGLSGAADSNRDSVISAKEIVDYARDILPNLYQNYLSEAQQPVSLLRGSDFPVGERRNR